MESASKPLGGEEHHQMLPYDGIGLQSNTQRILPVRSKAFNIPYRHFALMYINGNGELEVEASPSVAGCGKSIFTSEVKERFLKCAALDSQGTSPSFTGLGIQERRLGGSLSLEDNHNWYQISADKSQELIPCDWQFQQNKRQKRSPKRRDQKGDRRGSTDSTPSSPSFRRTALQVGDESRILKYYERAFDAFQQLNCRVIAKAFIKLVEPRKQVNHPYNGRKIASGSSPEQRLDPEMTKPRWWPQGVTHKEPDHLLKAERIRLLIHILRELGDSHGITAEKLRDAGQDVRRQIQPTERLKVLDEIYNVRSAEERYLRGEIDGDSIIYVTQVHLADANIEFEYEQDTDGDSQSSSAAASTVGTKRPSVTAEQISRPVLPHDGFPSLSSLRNGMPHSTPESHCSPYVPDSGQLKQATHEFALGIAPSCSIPASPHEVGPSCMPNYFTQPLMIAPGRPPQPALWDPSGHTSPIFPHGY
ncbi:hypothetical protein DTO280E4_4255 [Paecilomyces variotii]|nr:hypothetical protein DTO207G8_3114 [Paecilomyces variotii]KAJ9360538.1 hypothetical protein DTO280E4_4255 [Paecilomyces variotii]